MLPSRSTNVHIFLPKPESCHIYYFCMQLALIVAQRYHLETEYDFYRATEYRRSLSTYIRMNSHICHSSPSFRVAINWRRKEIDRRPGAKKIMDTHPGITTWIHALLRRRHSWIRREVIHVRSETVSQMTLHLLVCKYGGIRLTSKTCYPLGSIATELAP